MELTVGERRWSIFGGVTALAVIAVLEAAITSSYERREVALPLTDAERAGWRPA